MFMPRLPGSDAHKRSLIVFSFMFPQYLPYFDFARQSCCRSGNGSGGAASTLEQTPYAQVFVKVSVYPVFV